MHINGSVMKICEAVGCDAEATAKVVAKVGAGETIFLFLCENCKPKFIHPGR